MSDFPLPIVPNDVHQRGVVQASFSSDDRMVVWFFRKSVQNGAKSEAEGRPIFEGVDFVHIQQPGERDYIERPVYQSDVERWPAKWHAYQEKREQEQSGTPLATLFPNQPEVVDMLRAFKITVVEQLASLTEPAIARLGMGARENVKRAQDFLEASKGMALGHALQKQLEAKDDMIRELESRLAALEAAASKRKV